jgi:hypothetical protein
MFMANAGISFSQSNNDLAKVAYMNANEAFAKQEYSTCVKELKSAINYLDTTNVRIQYLLSKACFQLKEYTQAKVEIQSFFGFNPPVDDFYREIANISKQIDDQQQAQAAAEAAKKADEADWKSACVLNIRGAYQNYVSRYPNGTYIKLAKEMVSWLTAKETNTNQAYSDYLNKYPSGTYARQAKEEAAYRKATEGRYIENYEEYAKAYPSGLYKTQVNAVLQRDYFSIAEDYLNKKEYENARKFYKKYLFQFPSGDKTVAINARLKQIDQIYIDQANQKKRDEQAEYIRMGNESKKQASKYTFLGTTKLIGGLALIGGGAYLEINEANNVDGNWVVTLLGGGLIIVGIPLVVNSFLKDFTKAGDFKRKSKDYFQKANSITVSFRPLLDIKKQTYGLSISMKF